MSESASISDFLLGVREGDPQAVERLWREYFPRLVTLARARLAGSPKRMADEEDAALSALNSFCQAAREGRFPKLTDRDGLWRLLLRMTVRKVVDQRRREQAAKRGGQRLGGLEVVDIDAVVGSEPTPEFAAILAEEFEERLSMLDPELREIAVARFEGEGVGEIAERMNCARSTIERRLRLIRVHWSQEDAP